MKRILVLSLTVLFLVPTFANAKDLSGRFGLGYFDKDAPVGIRYWVNEKVGIDVGFGFNADGIVVENTSTNPSTYSTETATSFWLEAGLPIVIFPTERANFAVRPGVVFASLDDRTYGSGALEETWTQISFTLAPMAEVFFGEHFSLEAGHGIQVDLTTPPDDIQGGESTTDIRTFDASVTYLGFHFYFK